MTTPALHRLLWIVCLAAALGACKKKRDRPPKSLKSVSTEKACRHFFRRVRACSPDINRARADNLSLEGKKRAKFLAALEKRGNKSLEDLNKLCDHVGWKVEQQLTEMDRCYRHKSCADFATCFVGLADQEVGGPMTTIPGPIQELREKLQRLKKHRGHRHGPPTEPPPAPPPMR